MREEQTGLAWVVVAVITNESHKPALIEITRDADLIAPVSLPVEIGNAFSAMIKRKRIGLEQALLALEVYQRIPIRLSEVVLEQALERAARLDMYAYDAYVLACAEKHRCALVSLDGGLVDAAKRMGIEIVEVAI